jgi:hypothetical protein
MRSFASLLLGGIVLDGSCRIRSGARSLHERGASSLRVCRNIASSTALDAGTSVRWGHCRRMSRKKWWSRKPMYSLLQFRRRNLVIPCRIVVYVNRRLHSLLRHTHSLLRHTCRFLRLSRRTFSRCTRTDVLVLPCTSPTGSVSSASAPQLTRS